MLVLAPTAELAQQVRFSAFSQSPVYLRTGLRGECQLSMYAVGKRVPIIRYRCNTTSMHCRSFSILRKPSSLSMKSSENRRLVLVTYAASIGSEFS